MELLNPLDRSEDLVKMLPQTCVEEGFRFLGAKLPSLVARKVAQAEYHPISHEPVSTRDGKQQQLDRKKRKRFQSPNISDQYRALIPPMHVLEREGDFNLEPYEKAIAASATDSRSRQKPPPPTQQQMYSVTSSRMRAQESPTPNLRHGSLPQSIVHNLNKKIHTMIQPNGTDSWRTQPEMENEDEPDERGAKAAEKWDKILGTDIY